MKKINWLRTLAASLCMVVFLTGCSGLDSIFSGLLGDETGNRRTVPYSEMVYERPDVEAMETSIIELTEKAKNAESYKELVGYENEVGAQLSHFNTMNTLAMLGSYHDTTDAFFEEEYRYCEDESVSLWNVLNEFNRVLVEGEFRDDYREEVGENVFKSIENNLLLNSPSVEDYKKQRNQLGIDYNNRLSSMTLSRDGIEYTMDDIEAIYEADGWDTYADYLLDYYKSNAEEFTGYYQQMIDLDRQTAYELGFDSPAEMYYMSFSRDYTPEDALQYCQNTKEIFVPVALAVFNEDYYRIPADMDITFAEMPAALRSIDPELERAWKHMIKYGLYDYAPTENKNPNVAFTTTLSDYDAPFCYGYWEDDFNSATTVMHEFGHYYDDWLRYNSGSVFNLDVAEVYSQGLELLLQEQFGSFTEYPREARQAHLRGFADTLLYQALLEEFQQQIYAMDSFDAQIIARTYASLMKEYGLEEYSLMDENGCDYSWYMVSHLFDSPFYTISYWTSACVALEMWSVAQSDWDAGVKLYMDMIHADQTQPFTELITSVGLKDPANPETLQGIADQFMKEFRLRDRDLIYPEISQAA